MGWAAAATKGSHARRRFLGPLVRATGYGPGQPLADGLGSRRRHDPPKGPQQGTLLDVSGPWVHAYFASLDPAAIGSPVSWAGPEPAPVWLDVAREYTERWHHQQQIRDALGAPSLETPELFAPVLATFVFALPHTFRDVAAPTGTRVHLQITGLAGGDWTIERVKTCWELKDGTAEPVAASASLDQSMAWRLFTRGLSTQEAERAATLVGDPQLSHQVLRTVSTLA